MSDPAVDFGILAGAGAPVRSFKAGETIFKEGDPAEELFVVKRGSVDILLAGRVMETVRENGIFGELALIDQEPRAATVLAATDVDLVPVSERQFLFLVSQTPHFALKVMRVLAGRMRTLNKAL
jgi:CRP/FNR family transcriptional regulator, cyclic AMP receptor protein